jgi:hypothetical protein
VELRLDPFLFKHCYDDEPRPVVLLSCLNSLKHSSLLQLGGLFSLQSILYSIVSRNFFVGKEEVFVRFTPARIRGKRNRKTSLCSQYYTLGRLHLEAEEEDFQSFHNSRGEEPPGGAFRLG